MQKSGKIRLPEGKNIAVNIGCDFDATSVWMGTFQKTSPAFMSRGEFGAEVGVPRILKLFKKYGIRGTWAIPGHTVDTHTDICKEIISNNHEVCHHGYLHEDLTPMSYEEEKRVMEKGLESLEKIGINPTGYRSPSWDFSPNTLRILEEYNFKYDSSLMGNDFHPYYIRPIEVNRDKGSVFKEPSNILEIPVSWFLDDFPTQEYIPGISEGLISTSSVLNRWISSFDYALQEDGACFVLTVHPQTSGRAHMIQILEEFINYAKNKGAWFTTLEEIYNSFHSN
ncbi:peptidoglycan/xylan/chitin deacetylase (PgdA/CDA1 family) [Virgibacillus halotolerans]|uniref:polysaccharide deacetylase family protein n=1 Tax=Virgibacillus halotolerans TaxID=1071053 RepID=UPI001961A9C2|nr:polysaccharide deacetylase [Virgibacillus halotolerans]MBM7598996.1 peptidoglycan/xylan/chitin deacetylase (PgdA/CDA1 family) [Virgibacillus halotolerans]